MPASSKTAPDHFDFILLPGKQWYTPKEVASAIGRSDQFVRDAFENQKFLGHMNNARARRGRERRRTYQIHRECVILFFLETANYSPDDFLDRLQELLRNRSPKELALIQRFLADLTKPGKTRSS
jgi:hypothetical protein